MEASRTRDALGMSDDPSPSSFPVHGVTANLLPAVEAPQRLGQR